MDPADIMFLTAAVAITVTFLLTIASLHLRRGVPLPPGSLGIPLIGETLQLVAAYRTENPEPFIDERVKKYGPVFKTHVFGEPTVFMTEPDTNRLLLQNEGTLFDCSYPGSISNLLGRHSLLLMKGELHKRMHSLTMSLGSSSVIRDRLLVDMDRLIRSNLAGWSDRILLMEEAKKITFELTMKQLMSFDPGEWTESLRKEYVLVIEGFFSVPSSIFSPTYRRAIQARTKVAEALNLVVRQRRKDKERDGAKKKDVLGTLLDTDDHFSDEQIADYLVALLVAGYETTSTMMTFAVKYLTETPRALAQLKEEHDRIRGKKDHLDDLNWEDYKSMTFTQCVINESLRMANIIGGVFRRAITDIDIKGHRIPKGWRVFASFRAVHLNPEHFEDARTFNPWRWQSNSGMLMPGKIFTPFGGGTRLCPGYEIARVAISIFLHRLLTTYSWIPTEDDKSVYFPTTRTKKRYPIHVRRLDATSDVDQKD
ncbi:hypothetical protein MLD38_009741 [Melastoma candidum]|uniref:Uncharacterized protein n=1 Tax=Melastoma candidum TaxID=119954 RepID=A0ACB9RYP7_9MYRT|nr:hypothetical protein MLD38_009741 [Melastoma candidum]